MEGLGFTLEVKAMCDATFWHFAFIVVTLLWTRDLLALRATTRKLKELDCGGDETKHGSDDGY